MVHFIGAGPGDPELLTIKGKKLIDQADVIIYAGSLVNKEVLAGAKEGAEIYNSATMTLEEVIEVMKKAEAEGKMTARVHTGDPAVFGAHREQMDELSRLGIDYDVIPGVSSFLATAAALKKEYTLPGVSQTVILTRMEGRTPMPPKEKLRDLAKHNSTMIIFLSVGMIEQLADTFKRRVQRGYTSCCCIQSFLGRSEDCYRQSDKYRTESKRGRNHKDSSYSCRRFSWRRVRTF